MAYDIAMNPRALLRTDAERELFDANQKKTLAPSPRPYRYELELWFGIEAINPGQPGTTLWRRPKAEHGVSVKPGTINWGLDMAYWVPPDAHLKDALADVVKARAAKSGTDLRKEVLAEVERCVCKDRQNTYGDAEDNFSDIAKIASVVLAPALKRDLTAAEVALFSAAIKMARLKTSPEHLDNWIDLAGYAVCGAGIVKRASEKR